MRFNRLVCFCFILISANAFTQSWRFLRHEVLFGAGATNFLGELGGADQIGTYFLKDLEFSMTRPVTTAGYRYIINKYMKVGGNLSFGILKGDDKLTKEPFRNNRNLHFRSPILELGIVYEYYPFKERTNTPYQLRGASGSSWLFSPYLFTGISGLWFNPKAKYTDGKWYALQPLSTEGQGLPGGPKPYKRITVAIPVGIGVKYAFDKHWSMGFEISRRFVFTDYIDDVSGVYYDAAQLQAAKGDVAAYLSNPALSQFPEELGGSATGCQTCAGQQRGNNTKNDAYMYAIFTVNYRFLKYRMHRPKF
jgi:hypothetical protein